MLSRLVRRGFGPLLGLFLLLSAAPSRADDLAAEADLQFELGAEAYAKGDFRRALEHFLASNRLSPNSNVVFNIARCYEQLGRAPDAYHFYSYALTVEKSPAARAKIEEALARLAPGVAVVDIASDPPGATIFIDRKDLGARGATPRKLGLTPGKHRVIIEQPGHEPAEAEVEVKLGEQRKVSLSLTAIVGTVEAHATPSSTGGKLTVDGQPSLGCTVPCSFQIAPGSHSLRITRDGFEPLSTVVEVSARKTSTITPELVVLRGSLVVHADARDAAVEVDGRTLGFTPTVLSLPVGPHRLRVKLRGYKTVDRSIEIKPSEEQRIDLRLSPVDEISAASRAVEAAEDAPASLSIIGQHELRAMRYPTIAEAMRGVRGAYVTDDRSYTFVGLRGLSRTQDYGNKVPVLQDGLLMNDNILVQSFTGHEGRTDLDDVERIEVVRGPSSLLYGTNAFLGVINVVTRSRDLPTFVEGNLTTSDHGLTRARATGNVRLGDDASLWTSVAMGRAAGRDFHFPEYASDPTGGTVRGNDGFDSSTVQGRFSYKAFTVQWFGSRRDKLLPTGEYETVLGAPSKFIDRHGRLEARFEPQITDALQSLTRAYAASYDFGAAQVYAPEDGGVARERYTGRWLGVEQRFVIKPVSAFDLTVGGEMQQHLVATMKGEDDNGSYLDESQPYAIFSGYGIANIRPASPLKVSGGARVDHFSTFGTAVSPRAAVIVRPYDTGTTKLIAGKAFRAPSLYELRYRGALQEPAPGLGPETILSAEIEHTHGFADIYAFTAAAYVNRINDLVVPRTLDDEGRTQLTNSGVPVTTMGAEAELSRKLRDGFMLSVWYAAQLTRYESASKSGLRDVPNSPQHLASLKLAFPLFGPTLSGMTRLTVESSRNDRHDGAADPPQESFSGGVVWDVMLSGETENKRVNYAAGLYNVGDYRYSYPVSSEFRQRAILQPGRTLLLSLGMRF